MEDSTKNSSEIENSEDTCCGGVARSVTDEKETSDECCGGSCHCGV